MDKAQVIEDIKYKEWKDAFKEITKVNEYVFETREQAKTHLKSIDFCLAVWMDACEYMEMKSQASDDLERIDKLDIDEICHIKCKTRKALSGQLQKALEQNKIMREALDLTLPMLNYYEQTYLKADDYEPEYFILKDLRVISEILKKVQDNE